MTLHRFMSELEYERLMAGEVLVNKTVHRRNGQDSDAVGFCFFSEEPEQAVHWLKGACCTDVLVTFDVPDGFMHSRTAYYRNPNVKPPYDLLPENRVPRIDYCCEQYSSAQCRPVAHTTKFRITGFERIFVMQWCRSYHYTEQ